MPEPNRASTVAGRERDDPGPNAADPLTAWLRRRLGPAADRVAPATVARVALGAMLVLAGVHKLLAPDAWAAYVTDWLAPWLVVSPTLFMLANGPLEVLFGGLIAVDRFTVISATVAAVSLSATVAYLALAAATTGAFVDVLVRDVGLAGLAWAVLLDAVGE